MATSITKLLAVAVFVGNSKSQLHKAKAKMRELLEYKLRTAAPKGRTGSENSAKSAATGREAEHEYWPHLHDFARFRGGPPPSRIAGGP